ncbi:helix-turn-helix domain-containing protein [Spongiactinospora sp. TRM90649]|uniref:helix-turn-helix domain-containing protein n=1 Tax=Spongiactinospora sp. TRM90649 TaxID=3031114 RepID=UPI0023F6742B|nr:helix-turn-helix domain-containing protein [Spongiactinospora sp. TRM90649]MDF5752774.1 helix-turn-helix domain-containing protein [Spongiactinospora sp. TRM90649]
MYVERPPHPALAGRVACVWSQVIVTGYTQPVVPDGCVDLIWGPEGPHVAGPDTGPHPVLMMPGDRYEGVRFRPGAVGEVFGVPPAALRDERVPMDLLPGLSGLRLDGPADLLRAVAGRLGETPPPDPAAGALARALADGSRIGEVACDLGLSERQLHRRCTAAFGYGPKTLQRVVRFQRALRLARAGRPLADIAAYSGYTDQSHMANDVRRLAGMTLGQLLTRP